MTITIPCRHCDTELTAEDEDTLIDEVQRHAATHFSHVPSRDRILKRLERLQHREGA